MEARQSQVHESAGRPLVVGHRGAPSLAPENTLASFEAAIGCGAWGVECDVHLSLDGELMVIHDETLDRTTALTGKVAETDSSTMRAAGVPTLAEYLAVVKGRAVPVIELKSGQSVVQKVVERLAEAEMLDQAILFSFEEVFVREARPHAFTVRLSDQRPSLEGCDGIGVYLGSIDAALVQDAHAEGLTVFVWTVPPGPEVERLAGIGVDVIITDHPHEVLASQRSKLGQRNGFTT